MKNLWDQKIASRLEENSLQLRVYSSQLLGLDSDLVLHGGGNTSVKLRETNIFGEEEDILYVKGSGRNLATIDAEGFTPLRLTNIKKLAELVHISDTMMVREQQLAMTNPDAPSPSVEALLHAIIPFSWIDHTHADAVVTLTNTPKGEKLIQDVYGDRLLIIPYVMPGFKLARKVFEITQKVDWQQYEGMILLNHGIISFGAEAHESYERMINAVTLAEKFLKKHSSLPKNNIKKKAPALHQETLRKLARIRKKVSNIRGAASLARLNNSPEARVFSGLPNVKKISTRGPITSDHLIRTKPAPMYLNQKNVEKSIEDFASKYEAYFDRHTDGKQTRLDSAPRWGVWPEQGIVSFGGNPDETEIISDIAMHTAKAIQQAENMNSLNCRGWKPISEDHIFEAEYWELQQAKLKTESQPPEFEGKIAVVTGAASGIGLACAEHFNQQGAAVAGLDINPEINNILSEHTKSGSTHILGIQCDVTEKHAVAKAVAKTVQYFGGIDILVLNAGTFPAGQTIEEMEDETWNKSLKTNLTAPQQLLQSCVPFLKEGIDPSVVFIASRNVPAPGPGASAYSVPKAGQTQLARIAALELGEYGIRVNIIHPDCVYDTGLWTSKALGRSARRYGLTVEEYKSRNILKTDVKTIEVARMVCAMAGLVFAKTTGAQIPIDGGNERVI